MKMITPRMAILALILIMASAYFYDYDLFKTLLGWLLGGIIVNLVSVIILGQLIDNAMKNKKVHDLVETIKEELPDLNKLLKEGISYLKKILEKQKTQE